MNTEYGRLENGRVEYAPATLETEDGVKMNPTAESYLAAGWKRIVDERPAAEPGHRVEVSGWSEDGTTLTRVYKQVASAAKPRVFSKLKVVAALKKANKWVLVKTWMEEFSYYDYYLAAQDFVEGNEQFDYALAQLKELIGWSDAKIEELLSKCVLED